MRAVADYPDGVWMAELAPLTDPAVLADRLLTLFMVPGVSGRPPLAVLAEYLEGSNISIDCLMDEAGRLVQGPNKQNEVVLDTLKGVMKLDVFWIGGSRWAGRPAVNARCHDRVPQMAVSRSVAVSFSSR